MKKNMVIHCASGIKNSGDEAILSVLIHSYSEMFDITVISLNKEYTQRLHRGVLVLPNDAKETDEAIKSCDLFILGGGGLLQDSTSVFNIFRWLAKLKTAQKYGKKTYVYANSIGPLRYSFSRALVKKYLSRVDRITLRDQRSYQLLQKLGVVPTAVTADPVFAYKSTIEDKALVKSPDLPKSFVSVSIRHWYDSVPLLPVSIATKLNIRTRKNENMYERYITTIRQAVEYCNITLGLPVCFVSFCHGRDTKVANDILNTEELRRNNRVIDEEYITPRQTMRIIERSCFLIGMRLHSIIYAINSTTPVLPIVYEEKVKGIVELAGLQDYMLDVDTMTPDKMVEKISALVQNSEAQKELLRSFHGQMEEMEQKNQKICLELANE